MSEEQPQSPEPQYVYIDNGSTKKSPLLLFIGAGLVAAAIVVVVIMVTKKPASGNNTNGGTNTSTSTDVLPNDGKPVTIGHAVSYTVLDGNKSGNPSVYQSDAGNHNAYQDWIFEPTSGTGIFKIKHKFDNGYLDGDGTRVYLSDSNNGSFQKWKLVKANGSYANAYLIVQLQTGHALDGDFENRVYMNAADPTNDYQGWTIMASP
jgi:hypothetical protein